MSDYQHLQSVFIALGISYKATTNTEACYQPYQTLEIQDIEFWFNSYGDFLKVYQSQYDDHLEVVRKDSKVLREDDIVSKNLERGERADAARRQRFIAEQERMVSIRAQQRAEYRARYPLMEPTYAAMAERAQDMLTRGEVPTFEQAVDKIVQEDPEWFAQSLQASRVKASLVESP